MEEDVQQALSYIQSGKTYCNSVSNYYAGTFTNIEIVKNDRQGGFIATEIEKSAFSDEVFTTQKMLGDENTLIIYLKGILNNQISNP
ncbi:MAG: hypothetical protein SFU27_08780 [Thermonemataceae bacterium]|nr:hypothetical protein [Thermonemataceae bacterium]